MRVDEAPIESPCDEDLDRMRLGPGGLERHCDRCSKAVHDLSALGPERARALLAGAREPICISYAISSEDHGELVFDRPRPVRAETSGFVPLTRLAQAATLVASLAACTPHGDPSPLEIHESAPMVDAFDAPVVIPTQPATPIEPPAPEAEEPCEPEVEPQSIRRTGRIQPRKGQYKTAGVYNPSSEPL
jgi:hypothetical protein